MYTNSISGAEHTALQNRINECNKALGWFDKPVSFIEMMALLMTEVVEANDAVHDDGLLGGYQAGPQQASEFADCYIRLSDDCTRLGLDLGTIAASHQGSYETLKRRLDPDALSMDLIRRIRNAIEAYRTHGLNPGRPEISRTLAYFFLQLRDVCDYYAVDLVKEAEAKVAINWTRGYRHGGKFA